MEKSDLFLYSTYMYEQCEVTESQSSLTGMLMNPLPSPPPTSLGHQYSIGGTGSVLAAPAPGGGPGCGAPLFSYYDTIQSIRVPSSKEGRQAGGPDAEDKGQPASIYKYAAMPEQGRGRTAVDAGSS